MTLRRILIDSLEELSFSRGSLNRRVKAVESLERLLAEVCRLDNTTYLNLFLQLQDNFECNVASRVIQCVELAYKDLEQAVGSMMTSESSETNAKSISRQIIQLLYVLQGVALLHHQSKMFLGRNWCLQLLIDLLAISKHLYSSPLANTTNTRSIPSTINPNTTLASCLIDTILCILVDAPASIRVLEDIGGIEVVVKTLKRAGIPRDIRIKCLEFLYFYLMDETSDMRSISTTFPISRSSSEDNSSLQASLTPQRLSPFPSSTPDPPPRTPRKPRTFGLLRKDLDFVPITPKKVQVARLGVGTPRMGRTPATPGFGDIPPLAVSPTKRPKGTETPPLPASPTKRSRVTVAPSSGTILDQDEAEHRRTTQEKKEILSGLLGNVDVLVDSVAKSGIWGLG